MSQFQISPCTVADLDSMVDIYHSAFGNTYLNSFLFPPSPELDIALTAWLKQRFGKLLSQPQPELHHLKITDVVTGKVVAWSRWGYPFTLTNEEREKREAQKARDERDNAEGKTRRFPAGANEDVCRAFFGALDQMRQKYIKWDEDYVLYFLATHSDYQKRGIGTMLLNQGIAVADAEGKKIYLEATTAGHPLYLKLGWKDIDLITVDLKKWGGDKPGTNWVMMREPQADGAV